MGGDATGTASFEAYAEAERQGVGKTGLILRQGDDSRPGGSAQREQTEQVPADAPSLKPELR